MGRKAEPLVRTAAEAIWNGSLEPEDPGATTSASVEIMHRIRQ